MALYIGYRANYYVRKRRKENIMIKKEGSINEKKKKHICTALEDTDGEDDSNM